MVQIRELTYPFKRTINYIMTANYKLCKGIIVTILYYFKRLPDERILTYLRKRSRDAFLTRLTSNSSNNFLREENNTPRINPIKREPENIISGFVIIAMVETVADTVAMVVTPKKGSNLRGAT